MLLFLLRLELSFMLCKSQKCNLLAGFIGILNFICFPTLADRWVISSLLPVNNEQLHSRLENPFGIQSHKCCRTDTQIIRDQFNAKSTVIKRQERRSIMSNCHPRIQVQLLQGTFWSASKILVMLDLGKEGRKWRQRLGNLFSSQPEHLQSWSHLVVKKYVNLLRTTWFEGAVRSILGAEVASERGKAWAGLQQAASSQALPPENGILIRNSVFPSRLHGAMCYSERSGRCIRASFSHKLLIVSLRNPKRGHKTHSATLTQTWTFLVPIDLCVLSPIITKCQCVAQRIRFESSFN